MPIQDVPAPELTPTPTSFRRRFRLRFPPDLEKEFLAYYYSHHIQALRVLVLCFAFSCASVVLRMSPLLSGMEVSVPIRLLFGVQAVLLIASLHRKLIRYVPILFLAIFVIDTHFANLLMHLSTEIRPLGFGFALICIFYIYSLCRFRVFYASMLGWLIASRYLKESVKYGIFTKEGHLIVAGFFVSANIVGMWTAYFLERHARKDFLQRREIEREHARGDALLLSILPESIAIRLKADESPISDYFGEVTVLFADIVGFTSLCAGMPPQQMVSLLNDLFSGFDRLAESEGVEKIKTIGDAYMAVAGLPTPHPDHAERALRLALKLRKFAAELSEKSGWPIGLRVGVNSGPVVAGVIGRKKFIYDLWGDTVNIASRMEASGNEGEIRVSAATRAKTSEKFFFSNPETVTLKGVGTTTVYRLEGLSEDSRPELAA